MKRRQAQRRGWLGWAVSLAGVLVLAGACQKSRFATCENDDDCKSSDETKPYCFDLRCVGCAYDRHCAAGEACDTNSKSCVSLH